MASSSDEEQALSGFLHSDHASVTRSQRSFLQRAPKSILGVALALGVVAAAVWVTSRPQTAQESVAPPSRFEEKVAVGDHGIVPEDANMRHAQRKRLIVEQDLRTLVHVHVGGREAHFPGQIDGDASQACLRQAERLFDEVAEESDLEDELTDDEFMFFRRRFAAAMQLKCKDIISPWLWVKAAGEELEQQKPLATAATVASLNEANLGFTAHLHEWLLHESVASLPQRLGLLPTPSSQKDVLKRPQQANRTAAHLPDVFRAELKWPHCRNEILRIHNQGHCGSCWAFGSLASIDARMCIASGGSWNAQGDILSRLHATSCAPQIHYDGADGCQGGWPHWPMEMMASTGIASSSCLPYYIGGEGTEHFEHQDEAPPCETHCQGGYSIPLQDDTFSSAGVAQYDWLVHVHGDPTKMAKMRGAIYQEGPVPFAFNANHAFMSYHSGVFSVCTGHDRANHAVYAFGWGVVANSEGGDAVEYVEASNSWGTNWGADGHFRIHPRCITDVTIPGTIESTVVSHPVGSVDPDVPRDPENEYWPWAAPDECPFVDGCVTDMEGSGNYSNNELCVSQKLNGKRIRVAEFDLEYGYDTLAVNGKSFSGSKGAGLDESLDGLLVNGHGLTFTSDFSLNKPGFKLCMQ